jgi:hypothetical protein
MIFQIYSLLVKFKYEFELCYYFYMVIWVYFEIENVLILLAIVFRNIWIKDLDFLFELQFDLVKPKFWIQNLEICLIGLDLLSHDVEH